MKELEELFKLEAEAKIEDNVSKALAATDITFQMGRLFIRLIDLGVTKEQFTTMFSPVWDEIQAVADKERLLCQSK
jgi:hypothetical protein